jgi:hypothetical protein
MAVDIALELGPPLAITQNVVYSLPGQTVRVQAGAAIEHSIDGTNWAALTGANTVGVECASAFIRCTGGNTTVMVKQL